MKFVFSLLFIGFISNSFAQTGSLSGQVRENLTDQNIIGAKITLESKLSNQ